MTNKTISLITARLAFGLGAAFLIFLTALHFLEPEFDPSWRLISEYEIGKYGWLMSLAFFCLGGGFLLLLRAVWYFINTSGGSFGKWWLLLIVIALFGAGIFTTLPITNTTGSTTNNIHTICGVVVIFTFPIVATLLGRSLACNQEFKSSQRQLFWITFLVWIGMLSFLGSMIIYYPKENVFNPEVLIGWPNRFMMLTYSLWLLAVARLVKEVSKN